MPSELRNAPLDPLPPNATLTTVFADFMAYLLQCTKKFFEESSPNGATQWANLIDTAHFIISHPNGWEGPQQTKLRKAAVLALLVPDTMEGRARIHFVTEGEASLHFCLNEKVIEEGVDVSSPRLMSVKPFLTLADSRQMTMASSSLTWVEGPWISRRTKLRVLVRS